MKNKIIGFYRQCDLLTMTGTTLSFIGLLMVLNGHYTIAAFCLLLSGICDGFDGKLARMHKSTKDEQNYGVQLDSLSDVICFGVLPAVITAQICDNIIGYIISAVYMLCGVVRLAYFNMLAASPKHKKGIYIGVPITIISIAFPIIMFIVRFINYEALRYVLPILLAIFAILFVARIEIKKVDVGGVLNKIFNKYTVNFIAFPAFIVLVSDFFFKINNFVGRAYVDVFTTIIHNFLPFVFVFVLMALLMIVITAIFNDSKKAKITLLILMVVFLVINDIKYSIMGLPIQLIDVNYLNPDNMAMMGTASSSIGLWIIRVIIKCIALIIIGIVIVKLDKFHNFKFKTKKSRILYPIGSIIVLIIPFLFITKVNNFMLKNIYRMDEDSVLQISDIKDLYYEKGFYQGMYLDHLGKKFIKPGSYNEAKVRVALEEAKMSAKKGTWGKANVVVILSEAFSDLNLIDEIKFDKELTPNINDYKDDDDKIVTKLNVSPFAGTSVNSEFEVLTGASLSFLQNGFVPWTQYYSKFNKTYTQSLISEFNNNGYETMYITPWGKTSYNSQYVYNLLGVDKTRYNLKGKKKGQWYSDESLTNALYDELKSTSEGDYKFIVTASAQNHFPYEIDKYTEKEYDIKISETSLSTEDAKMLRAYAQGIYDADKALGMLYEKIQKLDTPTIIVFYGDHFPSIVDSKGYSPYTGAAYFNTGNAELDNLRIHTTQAVILANYDIDVDNLEYINSSYLGAYVLNKMDLKISDYFKFVNQTRGKVPVFNRSIIYDVENEEAINIDDADEKTKAALENYKYVQYKKFYDSVN